MPFTRPTDPPSPEFLRKLAGHEFYHCIDLGSGVETDGWKLARPGQQLVLSHWDNIDFNGKRVLDLGCRDGMYSFKAEERGAAEVIAVDNFLSNGMRELLIPHFQSDVQLYEINLMDLTPDHFGTFDVVNFPGVLYHLRYPFQALKIIRDLVKPGGTFLLETATLRIHESTPLMYCPAPHESPYEKTSVTFFNQRGMIATLNAFGFEVIKSSRLFGLNAFRLPHTNLRFWLGAIVNSAQRVCPQLVRFLFRRYYPDRGVFVCRFNPDTLDPEIEKYWNATYNHITYD